MTTTEDRPLRAVSDFSDEPQIAWSTRTVGRHMHPGITCVPSVSEWRGARGVDQGRRGSKQPPG